MSLNWNLSAIRDQSELCWRAVGGTNEDGSPWVELNPVTHALIWATIFVDLGKITDSNAADFHCRLRLWTKLHGPLMSDGYEPTLDDVRAHIGLTTNVADKRTDVWAKRVALQWMRERK